MADNPTSPSNGTIAGVTGRVLTSLPGQFLALVLVNVIFILGILWFLEKQQEIASRVATDVFTRCISAALTVPGPQQQQQRQ